jgi:hypothetical protein
MPDLRLGQTTLTDPREIDLGPCQTQEPWVWGHSRPTFGFDIKHGYHT